jgi:hypothetical protein
MNRTMKTGLLAALLTVGMTTTITSPVQAGDISDDWRFVAAPYLWAMSIDGDLTVRGTSTDVSIDFFDDIISELDFAAYGHLEAGKGRWGVFFDNVYSNISAEDDTAIGNVKFENTLFMMEIGGLFRVSQWSGSNPGATPGAIEILGGVRYWEITGELTLPNADRPEQTGDWTDPFVGARVAIPLTDKLMLSLRGDVGGFSYGSDFSWNVVGLVGYEFTPLVSAWGGYRAVGVEYDEGSGHNRFEIDATFHGPMIGGMFRF